MLKGILFLIAFGLLPWWLSLLADRMDIPLSPSAFLSSWMRDDGLGARREVPPPGWREAVYFARNPDVMASVRRGEFRSGYEHYVKYGQSDGRPGGIPGDPPGPAAIPLPPQAPVVSPAPVPPAPAPAKPVVVAVLPEAPPLPPPPPPRDTTVRENPPATATPVVLPTRKPVPLAPPLRSPASQGPASQGPANQVLGIRSASHPGFIRIVLDSQAALRAERMAQPAGRVAGIELASAGWQPARQGRLVGKSLSYRVETADGVTRLLLESGEAIRIKALFALPPEQPGGHHRLILDMAQAD